MVERIYDVSLRASRQLPQSTLLSHSSGPVAGRQPNVPVHGAEAMTEFDPWRTSGKSVLDRLCRSGFNLILFALIAALLGPQSIELDRGPIPVPSAGPSHAHELLVFFERVREADLAA